MIQKYTLLLIMLSLVSCTKNKTQDKLLIEVSSPEFGIKEATNLIELPLLCYNQEYPYKPGITLENESDLRPPKEYSPIFYGCFDWHSAVHGYWSMITLVKNFPEIEQSNRVRKIIKKTFTEENVAIETEFFSRSVNASYERTYGWNWLLKLADELYTWEDPLGKEIYENLKPLTDLIVARYKEFLPKLVYPIRVGEHTNTAFGLSFAYDYAVSIGEDELRDLIKRRAIDFYMNDANCPIDWEPSGFDFLSPCFEEINIMRRVLEEATFLNWLDQFLPELKNPNFSIEYGIVSDREDGKLVHLDGLNFSRAWSMYALAHQHKEYAHLKNIAHEHMNYSLPNLVDDSYEGGHWLGSFAIYALQQLHHEVAE